MKNNSIKKKKIAYIMYNIYVNIERNMCVPYCFTNVSFIDY